MPLAKNLLHPSPAEEKRKHKLKRLVQHPNSYFMDVKCPGCYKITTVFSHAQSEVICAGCFTILCQPTGGKARLTEDDSCDAENLKRQEDEMFVLQTVYNPDEMRLVNSQRPPYIGSLKIPITPKNDHLTVHFKKVSSSSSRCVLLSSNSCVVRYLLVELFFFLPAQYPSTMEPCYVFRCVWLPDNLLLRVSEKLSEIWRQSPCEVLFTWASFLTQDLWDFLGLSNEITVTEYESCPSLPAPKKDAYRLLQDDSTKRETVETEKGGKTKDAEAVIFENNPVLYKKYLKEKLPAGSGAGTGDDNCTRANGEDCVEAAGSFGEKAKSRASKNNHAKRKPAKRLITSPEYVKLNDKIKYVYRRQGKSTERYKYETESETKKKLESELFFDGDVKKYAVTSSSVRDLNCPPEGSADSAKKTEDSPCAENDSIVENEKFIYGWLEFRSRWQLTDGAVECRKTSVVPQRHLNEADKLRSLKEYNLSQFNRNQCCCEICYANKFGSSCLLVVPCCHIFCKDCTSEYVRTCIIGNNRVNNLTCPMTECDVVLGDYQLESVIDGALYRRYKDLKLKFTLENHRDLLYCPRQVCQNIAFVVKTNGDEAMGHCRQCQYYFCALCKKAYHGREPCDVGGEQRRRIVDEYMRCDDEETKKRLEKQFSKKQLDKWMSEELSERWICDNGRPCPNCKAVIEKYTGCNKVLCTKCSTPFCWVCRKVLKDGDPYAHFRDANSSCYNKLFYGVDVDDDSDDDDDYALYADDDDYYYFDYVDVYGLDSEDDD